MPRHDRQGRNKMDFEDTPEEAAFRTEVRNWLAANAPKGEGEAATLVNEFESHMPSSMLDG